MERDVIKPEWKDEKKNTIDEVHETGGGKYLIILCIETLLENLHCILYSSYLIFCIIFNKK